MANIPKPYHHGDLRRVMIDTAMDMLAEGQSWQFTLRELARRAGVSHTASYKHFPDKAALLSELAGRGFDQLRTTLLAARPKSPVSAREEYLAMARTYVRFGVDNANLYRLMFSPDAHCATDPVLERRGAAALDVLIDLITAGQKAGWLRDRPARLQAGAAWAMLHGLTLLTADQMLEPTVGEPAALDAALEVLLQGLEKAA